MSWTNIPTTDIDQDSPVTQPLMVAIRDNIQFAWECTWHPYDMVYPGDGNDGVIYDQGVDGDVASVETPDWVDDFEYMCYVDAVSPASSAAFNVEVYKSTDANYGDVTQLNASVSTGGTFSGWVYFRAPRATVQRHIFTAHSSDSSTDGSADTDTYIEYDNTAQKRGKARFSFTSQDIDAGKIYMYRRRELWGL